MEGFPNFQSLTANRTLLRWIQYSVRTVILRRLRYNASDVPKCRGPGEAEHCRPLLTAAAVVALYPLSISYRENRLRATQPIAWGELYHTPPSPPPIVT